MLNINIICVGKIKENYLKEACEEYEKRLKSFCNLKIIEVSPVSLSENPSQSQIDCALEEEAEKIISKVGKNDVLIPLCIEGKQMTSEKLSELFENYGVSGNSSVTFVIGGSHGLSETLKAKGNFKMSMSEMTFPHRLARVMLLEQIYRAFSISCGSKYHK